MTPFYQVIVRVLLNDLFTEKYPASLDDYLIITSIHFRVQERRRVFSFQEFSGVVPVVFFFEVVTLPFLFF
jgi:hypothetical protein